ncbi:hypothetical protein IWQ60_002524 [Tieghemiomyces parasiticus]|uniref:Uncharacterized protein n=1 Tax=Tieghemiomyces parasiticus TaxID=78921 RepID=A0A9W8AHB0_9FUNG|nr:hypothetical protein IWQ60_002524 [Tieghemiomyces parasiticus]
MKASAIFAASLGIMQAKGDIYDDFRELADPYNVYPFKSYPTTFNLVEFIESDDLTPHDFSQHDLIRPLVLPRIRLAHTRADRPEAIPRTPRGLKRLGNSPARRLSTMNSPGSPPTLNAWAASPGYQAHSPSPVTKSKAKAKAHKPPKFHGGTPDFKVERPDHRRPPLRRLHPLSPAKKGNRGKHPQRPAQKSPAGGTRTKRPQKGSPSRPARKTPPSPSPKNRGPDYPRYLGSPIPIPGMPKPRPLSTMKKVAASLPKAWPNPKWLKPAPSPNFVAAPANQPGTATTNNKPNVVVPPMTTPVA